MCNACATSKESPWNIFDYIETVYNTGHRHSTPGQVSPTESNELKWT
jgi:hypothetical protein